MPGGVRKKPGTSRSMKRRMAIDKELSPEFVRARRDAYMAMQEAYKRGEGPHPNSKECREKLRAEFPDPPELWEKYTKLYRVPPVGISEEDWDAHLDREEGPQRRQEAVEALTEPVDTSTPEGRERALRQRLALLVVRNPGLRGRTVDELKDMLSAVDLGHWSEIKRGYENAEIHWEWSRLAQEARRAAILAPREHGKALALDTPVATPDGFHAIGDLLPGDRVIGRDGKPDVVLAVTEVQHDRPCYRIRFNDGSEFVADGEHEWFTHYGWRGDRVVTTEKIAQDLEARRDQTHVVDCVAVEYEERVQKLDPYCLGYWLGDGTASRAEITTADPEVIERFEAEGFRSTYRYQRGEAQTVGFRDLLVLLKELRVLGDKGIPHRYLYGSRRQRLELLRGLMDSDGYCSPKGQVEFCTTNPHLRDGVLHLVASLGWKAMLATDRAVLHGVDHGPRYRVWWYPEEPVFHLERKASRQRVLPEGRRSKAAGRGVVSVERVESVPVVCIQTGSGGYLIGDRMVLTHNSEVFSVNNAAWHSIYRPGF